MTFIELPRQYRGSNPKMGCPNVMEYGIWNTVMTEVEASIDPYSIFRDGDVLLGVCRPLSAGRDLD